MSSVGIRPSRRPNSASHCFGVVGVSRVDVDVARVVVEGVDPVAVQAVMVNNMTLVASDVTILMTIFLVGAADEVTATYSEGDVLLDDDFGALVYGPCSSGLTETLDTGFVVDTAISIT